MFYIWIQTNIRKKKLKEFSNLLSKIIFKFTAGTRTAARIKIESFKLQKNNNQKNGKGHLAMLLTDNYVTIYTAQNKVS